MNDGYRNPIVLSQWLVYGEEKNMARESHKWYLQLILTKVDEKVEKLVGTVVVMTQ